jgi:hypothetical protein
MLWIGQRNASLRLIARTFKTNVRVPSRTLGPKKLGPNSKKLGPNSNKSGPTFRPMVQKTAPIKPIVQAKIFSRNPKKVKTPKVASKRKLKPYKLKNHKGAVARFER